MNIGVIIAGVLLIGIAIFLWIRFKKKQKEKEEAKIDAAATSIRQAGPTTAGDNATANAIAVREPVLTKEVQSQDRARLITIFNRGGGAGAAALPRPGILQNFPRFRRR